MRCRNCGRDEGEDERICSRCGTGTASFHADRRGSGKMSAIAMTALLVAIVAVAALIAVNALDDKSTDPGTTVVPGDTDDTDDTSETDPSAVSDSITYTSDDSDLFTVATGTNASGQTTVTVTMVDSEASKYSEFTWYVYKEGDGYFSKYHNSVTKTDATATWTLSDGTYGNYIFGVICEKSTESGTWSPWRNSTEYTLTFTVNGTVSKTYSWEYLDQDLTFTISYSYSEYDKYAGTNGATLLKRAGNNNGSYDVIPDFIVVNSTVTEIESNLESLYEQSFGSDASGQGYAEFILAFVQECFTYTYDQTLYRQSEYYAFPMETIHNGSGDCEDTSILCAAIFVAAGYDAGVFLIPGHAIAAVALDSYDSSAHAVTSSYKSKVAVFSLAKDGKTYYGCETTLESNEYGVGYISTDYAIKNGVVYYQNKAYTDGAYGLYLAASTA